MATQSSGDGLRKDAYGALSSVADSAERLLHASG